MQSLFGVVVGLVHLQSCAIIKRPATSGWFYLRTNTGRHRRRGPLGDDVHSFPSTQSKHGPGAATASPRTNLLLLVAQFCSPPPGGGRFRACLTGFIKILFTDFISVVQSSSFSVPSCSLSKSSAPIESNRTAHECVCVCVCLLNAR